MSESLEVRLRWEFELALSMNKDLLIENLRALLANDIPLAEGDFLQFELFAWDGLEICCCETSGVILPAFCLDAALPDDWWDRTSRGDINSDVIMNDPLCRWFADCWSEVVGPPMFSPAYLFYHEYPGAYDLESRRWLSRDEPLGG